MMKHFLLYTKLISTYKAFEAQISGNFNISSRIDLTFSLFDYEHWFFLNIEFFDLIKFSIDWSRKRDHAGFSIELQLIYFFIMFNLYDTRHWNYDEDRFKNEEDLSKERAEFIKEISKKIPF